MKSCTTCSHHNGTPQIEATPQCVPYTIIHQALEESNRQLQAMNGEKEAMLALIDHEIRTPLTFVVGFGSLLIGELRENCPPSPTITEYSNHLLSAIRRLEILANEIGVAIRLISGSYQKIASFFDVYALLDKCISQADAETKSIGRMINFHLSPPTKRTIGMIADIGLLELAVIHLLSNATKFSDDNSHVTVEIAQVERRTIISVRDQGDGMPPEQMQLLGEPMRPHHDYLHHSSGKWGRASRGLGLGLPLCYKITQSLGGKLSIHQPKDGGSIIELDLPTASTEDYHYFQS